MSADFNASSDALARRLEDPPSRLRALGFLIVDHEVGDMTDLSVDGSDSISLHLPHTAQMAVPGCLLTLLGSFGKKPGVYQRETVEGYLHTGLGEGGA